MQIALGLIQPSPKPIRTTWDETKLDELAQSLKEQGQIQPVKVRTVNGCYEIVYGHRRVEAARRAGFDSVEAIVEELDDDSAFLQALIENIQREDMNPLDEGEGLAEAQRRFRWSQRELAEKLGLSLGFVQSRLTLLQQSPEIKNMLFDDSPKVTPKHILETNRVIKDTPLKAAILKKAAEENLSAEQTRRIAESIEAAPGEHAKATLLQRPYSQYTHDPELIKERADRFGAHDPMYSNQQRSTLNEDWQTTPDVQNVIGLMRSWMGSLTEFRKADKLGKMSPEAKGFVARRVRQFAEALIEWAEKLEEESGVQ